MNFFLFKRDKEFYNKAVKMLIENKLEKTFIDHFLLGMDIAGRDNEHAQFVLSYIGHRLRVDTLNTFEQCLLIEFTLLKGNDEEKANARIVAQNTLLE